MLAVGLRSGGEVEAIPFDRDPGFDAAFSYGLTYNHGLSADTALEIVWSRQDTELRVDGLFPDSDEFGMTVDYLHAGAVYRPQRTSGQRPYVAFSVGLSSLDPEPLGFDTDLGFSFAVSGGTTLRLGERVGLRLLGRGWFTFSEGTFAGMCGSIDCRLEIDGGGFAQYEASAGIVIGLN
jgi:hypothetical protein